MDDALLPDAAILDASLLAGVPGPVTADTGMDVLTHASEAYVARKANAFTDALAERAFVLAYENPHQGPRRQGEHPAKEQMLLASCMAGIAFNGAGLGATTPWPTPGGPLPHPPRAAQRHAHAPRHPLQRGGAGCREKSTPPWPRPAASAPNARRAVLGPGPAAPEPGDARAAYRLRRGAENGPGGFGSDYRRRRGRRVYARQPAQRRRRGAGGHRAGSAVGEDKGPQPRGALRTAGAR